MYFNIKNTNQAKKIIKMKYYFFQILENVREANKDTKAAIFRDLQFKTYYFLNV